MSYYPPPTAYGAPPPNAYGAAGSAPYAPPSATPYAPPPSNIAYGAPSPYGAPPASTPAYPSYSPAPSTIPGQYGAPPPTAAHPSYSQYPPAATSYNPAPAPAMYGAPQPSAYGAPPSGYGAPVYGAPPVNAAVGPDPDQPLPLFPSSAKQPARFPMPSTGGALGAPPSNAFPSAAAPSPYTSASAPSPYNNAPPSGYPAPPAPISSIPPTPSVPPTPSFPQHFTASAAPSPNAGGSYPLPPPRPHGPVGSASVPTNAYAYPQAGDDHYPASFNDDGPAYAQLTQQFNGMNMNQAAAPPQGPPVGGWSAGPQATYSSSVPSSFPVIPPWVVPTSEKYLSLSCGTFPSSTTLRNRVHVTFGGVLRPLAENSSPDLHGTGNALPIINPGPAGVIRCTMCRSYINPYVHFLDNGARWRCNLCGLHNDIPAPYFAPLDGQGKRADLESRPELKYGSVEILAPADYMVRQPMPPVYFFVIDVSLAAVRSGMLNHISNAILKVLNQLPGEKRTQIGFLTFDSAIHFYTFRAGQSTPQMFVLSDLDDIFLPQPNDLLVNLDECREAVEGFLHALPTMHSKTMDVETAAGPALDAALSVIQRMGGKLYLFLSSLPSLGVGRLTNRENARLYGTDKESVLLAPAEEFYRRKAINFTKYQVCCDVYFISQTSDYFDISTLKELSSFTGGDAMYYPCFSSAALGKKLEKEIEHSLTRTQGWEAVIRVRASKGVQILNFNGHFHLRGTDLLAIPAIDSDKAVGFELRNEETPSAINMPSVCVQSALLYTTSSGERRIRVHTACIPLANHAAELYEKLNVNTLNLVVAKQAASLATQSMDRAREHIRNKAVAVLRTHKSMFNQPGAVPLPGSAVLNLLPLLTLGLLKNVAFKDGNDVRSDVRSIALGAITTMGVEELETFVRPRIFAVHDLSDKFGMPVDGSVINGTEEDGSGAAVHFPTELSLTAESIKSDMIVLIDNGFELILRIGRAVSPDILQQLFGVPSFESIDIRSVGLVPLIAGDSSSLRRRLSNILSYLRHSGSQWQQLFIVKEGDSTEVKFLQLLIEDRYMQAFSLNEFLQFIYRAQNSY